MFPFTLRFAQLLHIVLCALFSVLCALNSCSAHFRTAGDCTRFRKSRASLHSQLHNYTLANARLSLSLSISCSFALVYSEFTSFCQLVLVLLLLLLLAAVRIPVLLPFPISHVCSCSPRFQAFAANAVGPLAALPPCAGSCCLPGSSFFFLFFFLWFACRLLHKLKIIHIFLTVFACSYFHLFVLQFCLRFFSFVICFTFYRYFINLLQTL